MNTPKTLPNYTSYSTTPVIRPSLRDHEEEVAELRKQNFNLKLRCYYLEEKLNTVLNDDGAEIVRKNVELCVRVKEKEREIENKDSLLRKARAAISKLSQQLEEANEGVQLQLQSTLDESLSHEWTSRELHEQETRVASLEFQSTSLANERDVLVAQLQAVEQQHKEEVEGLLQQITELKQAHLLNVELSAKLEAELTNTKKTCQTFEQASGKASIREQKATEQMQQMLIQIERLSAAHLKEKEQLQQHFQEEHKAATTLLEQEISRLRTELATDREVVTTAKSRFDRQIVEQRQELELSINMLQLEVTRLRAELDLQAERETQLQRLLTEYLGNIADGEHKLKQTEVALERCSAEILRLTQESSERLEQREAVAAELTMAHKLLKEAQLRWEHERSSLLAKHYEEVRATTDTLHRDHTSAEEQWQNSYTLIQKRCNQLQESYSNIQEEMSHMKAHNLALQAQVDNCKLEIAQAEQQATSLQQRLTSSAQANETLRAECHEQRTVIEHYHQLILLTRARLVDFLTESGDNTVARFLGTPLAEHLKSEKVNVLELDLSPITPTQLQFDAPHLSHGPNRTEAVAKELAADIQSKLAALTQMKTLLQSFYWTLYQKYLALLGQVNLKASLHNNHIESLGRTIDLLKRRVSLNSEENTQLASRLHAAEAEWEGSSMQLAQLRDLLWQKEEKYLQTVYQCDQQKVRITTLEELNETLGTELSAKRQALNAQHLRTANLRLEFETLQAAYDRLKRDSSETTEQMYAARRDLSERIAEIALELTQLVDSRPEISALSSGYLDVQTQGDTAAALRRSWLARSQKLLGKCRELQRNHTVFVASTPAEGSAALTLPVNTNVTM